MTKSGYLNAPFVGEEQASKTYEFYTFWKVLSQSTKKTSSRLYISFGLRKVASNTVNYNMSGSAKLNAILDDETIKDGSVYFDMRSRAIGSEGSLYNKTFTVYHDENGRASLNVSADINTDVDIGTAHISGVIVLPTIPKESTISASDAVIGSTSFVAVGHSFDQYTHSVAFSFGGLSGYLDDKGNIVENEHIMSTLDIPFKIPEEFAYKIPDSLTGVVELTCTTYDGGTQIGTPQKATFTVTVPSYSPYVKFEVQDIDETALLLSEGYGYIKNLSDLKCTLTTEGVYGSSIVTRIIDGVSLDNDGTIVFTDVQKGTVSGLVKDSRGVEVGFGRGGSGFVEYFPPTIRAAGKREQQSNNNVLVNVSGSFYCGAFAVNSAGPILGAAENNLSVSYRARHKGGEWTSYYALQDYDSSYGKNDYSFNATIEDIDYRYVWEIEFLAQDKAKSESYIITIPKGMPLFDWGESDMRFHIPLNFDDGVKEQTRENLGIASPWMPVWKNATPSSDFPAQDLTIDGLGEYNTWLVIAQEDTETARQVSVIVHAQEGEDTVKGSLTQASTNTNLYAWNRERNFTITRSTDTIKFTTGYKGGASAGSNAPSAMIPLYIYGSHFEEATI